MLQQLKIQNFALISKLDLNFENGFTVFTGETGSGKSILLGALNLILGERADFSVIRDINQKTIVEAQLKINDYQLENFFKLNDLDFSDEILIRREITNQGKSRAFINDTPVQLSILKEFSEKLIHIHSQHHTLELKNELYQLDILDYLSDSIDLRKNFKKSFNNVKKLNSELNLKKELLAKSLLEEDYIQFQVNELEKLNLEKTNYSELEKELNQQENLATLKECFFGISQGLSDENQVLDKLTKLKNILEKNQEIHPKLNEFLERIKSVLFELKDISSESDDILESLIDNPLRTLELENSISAYNSILLKHQLTNQDDLLELYSTFQSNASKTEDLKLEISSLENELSIKEKDLLNLGNELHENRLKHKKSIEQKLTHLLVELKMENSIIDFAIEKLSSAQENGFSKVSILFSPNKGLAPKSLDKTASGGELSRFMLAIQLLLSEKKKLPTLIFDEIDTGVSGEVAQKIGDLLKKMGKTIQLIAITHLPQVAAKGQYHFKVSKSEVNNSTETDVFVLNNEEKTHEIARLLSGEKINEAAIQNAVELMK